MIFWILAAGVVVLAFVLLIRKDKEGYYGSKEHRWWWGKFFFVLLFGAMGLCIYLVAAIGIIQTVAPSVINQYSVPLSSLSDGSATSGRFFLGSGVIDDERVISYVYGDDSMGYRTTYSSARYSVIYQDAIASNASLTVIEKGVNNWVFLPHTAGMGDDRFHYDFHVPKGSIISNFQVDSNSNN